MASTSKRHDSDQQHRRETILFLIVPMILAGAMVLGGGVVALLLPRRLQISLIADWMISVMFLCPAVLCLYAICAVLIVAVAGMNKLHQIAAAPLNRLENASETFVDKAEQVAETINQTTASLSTQLAPLDNILGVFDEPPATENGEQKDV